MQIRDAVKTVLKRIITNNDAGTGYVYYNTITENHIGSPPRSVERMGEFPFINVYYEDERCANSNASAALQTGGNRQLWHNTITLVMDCWLVGDNILDEQDKILADIQAAFGNDYTINNSAFSCAYESSSPFGTESNRPSGGITVRFNVWYRIYQTNPALHG